MFGWELPCMAVGKKRNWEWKMCNSAWSCFHIAARECNANISRKRHQTIYTIDDLQHRPYFKWNHQHRIFPAYFLEVCHRSMWSLNFSLTLIVRVKFQCWLLIAHYEPLTQVRPQNAKQYLQRAWWSVANTVRAQPVVFPIFSWTKYLQK